jgi:transcription elongation factor Elf1
MIIFGLSNKQKTLGEGDFYCPRCGTRRYYRHQQTQRYFSLYFVPLVPLGKRGEFIVCQSCGMAFGLEVLKLKVPAARPRSLSDVMNHIEDDLKQGTPGEYVIRELTAAGLDIEVAIKTLEPYLQAGRKSCANCGLTYLYTITTCSSCGRSLS